MRLYLLHEAVKSLDGGDSKDFEASPRPTPKHKQRKVLIYFELQALVTLFFALSIQSYQLMKRMGIFCVFFSSSVSSLGLLLGS